MPGRPLSRLLPPRLHLSRDRPSSARLTARKVNSDEDFFLAVVSVVMRGPCVCVGVSLINKDASDALFFCMRV